MTVRKAQTIGKITTMGNSLGVVIDKKVLKVLNLKKGDYIQLTIEKFEEDE